MLPVYLSVLFVIGFATGSPLANQYFESVLNTAMRNELRMLNLDPAPVPNFITYFEDKVKIIGKVKGNAEFFHGNLTGLSGARRFSECQGPYYSFGSKTLNCTLSIDTLQIFYDGKMKYGKMPKVNIKGKANVSTTLFFVEVMQNPPMQPTVKNFLFTQIGQLNTKFTGLGPLNRFTKVLEDGFKSHVNAEIFNSLSQRYQYAFNRAVSLIPLPM